MAKKIKLQDLLFVDHRRLNHYAEIIAGSPTIIEKGSKFGVKFSITSIEVSAEQPETRRLRWLRSGKTRFVGHGFRSENQRDFVAAMRLLIAVHKEPLLRAI
jgi:hypothetical protein